MADQKTAEAAAEGDGKGPAVAKRRPKRAKRRTRNRDGAKQGRGRSFPFPPVAFLSVLGLGDAIQQHAAGQPIRRITIFDKLGKSPESSGSRLLITNSGRYGVTKGSYKAEILELTALGAVATSPDTPARERTAARFKLAIESVQAFKHLDHKNVGRRAPSPEVLQDSLAEIGLAEGLRKQCVDVFLENAKDIGLLRTMAGAERIVSIDQLLEEAPSADGSPTTATAAAEAGIQKVDKSKKSWKTTCFVIAPIDSEGSEQRKHGHGARVIGSAST